MDFFTATRAPDAASAPAVAASVGPTAPLQNTASEGVDAFAEAINARYSRAGTSLIPLSPNQHGSTAATAEQPLQPPAPTSLPFSPIMPADRSPVLSLRVPPPLRSSSTTTPTTSPSTTAKSQAQLRLPSLPSSSLPQQPPTFSPAPLPPSAFTALLPTVLPSVLAESAVLILDIRPHNAYATARLPSALSISVPSTLLKRPLFSLDRLAQMLSPATRARFAAWPTASRILIYDADTSSLTEGGNILGLLRKLRKEGFAGELGWIKGGFKAIWREQYDLVDHDSPAEDEDEDGELSSLQSAPGPPRAAALALEPGVGPSRVNSAPATTSSFPPSLAPSGFLRPKNLPMSAFLSSTTTSQRPYRSGVSANAIPSTPIFTQADPFASLGVTGVSSSSLPGTSSHPAPTGQPFALRLPPTSGRTPSVASASTIPEGRTLHVFPPRAGGHGPGAPVDISSSLPTQGAGAAYGMVPRERPHHQSFPGVGPPAQSVPFNPFFDTIRQNLELGGGRGSGEGIPLKLSRRVRRRVSELPFDWLREIARKSGKVSEENTSADSDKEEKPMPGMKARGALGASDVSESEDELAGTHHHRRRRLDSKLHKTVLRATAASSIPAADSPPDDGDELAKVLSMQFYKIELGEQRRLMGVMEHHSMESSTVVAEDASSARAVARMSQAMSKSATVGGFSLNAQGIPSGGVCGPIPMVPRSAREAKPMAAQAGQRNTGSVAARMLSTSVSEAGGALVGAGARKGVDREKSFPFSITAGVEKGDKNRYRNIWPFEHARVRLHKARPEDDDYMNASYVQPLGTTKRYIATQGPLPSTFADFWTLCWQENVHVIVMLTREVESALVKCGNYWTEGQYGPLHLKLVSTSDTAERERRRRDSEMSSGFFNIPQARAIKEEAEEQTIRRVFELTHSGYPKVPPRTITQLQYLDWPDLDVPKDPRGLLNLMREVDEVVERSRQRGVKMWGEGPLGQQATPALTPLEESKSASASSSDEEADGREVIARAGIDPATGVAHHALVNPPVLLHCSAGVGRTGGFIAVDAVLDGVRREMRKRREQQAHAKLSSSSGTRSPASSATPGESDETMEIDDRSSVNGSPVRGESLPVAVSAGVDKSDLPPAGGVPMEVDSDAPQVSGVIQPSVGLINEVRLQHAHLKQAGASAPIQGRDFVSKDTPQTTIVSPAPLVASPLGTSSATSSLASLVSGHRSPSTSAPSTSNSRTSHSRTSGSVSSRNTNSTTSLNSFVKSSEALIPEDHGMFSISPAAISGSVYEEGARASPPNAQAPASDGGMEALRLDSWRTGIRDNESLEQEKMLPTPRTSTFDYASPRPLHEDLSPPLLSTYPEPIRRVVEDMREQRMSLCQSLRQYVFVHRAIIEGALMVVDEERRRAQEDEMLTSEKEAGSTRESTRESSADVPERPTMGALQRASLALDIDKTKDHMSALRFPAPRAVSLADVHMAEHDSLQPSPSLPSPRSKRQASPTELVQTDSSGEARLMKRPSVKRSVRSPEDADGGLKLKAMVLSSPPPGGER
ncbi:hypothetical protein PHLGIDRAFT_129772 [Phlebiopsis gigantea 11061_1 CR5-6]|uniref:protein-tyrosine-phosphatase n=1 Tax=Phlebiopsis gigantea (strain 11061_1 CR5-6) TaxID=745531 RepID=A0A0C3RTL1_PHLG1|nr:hypothetical protein PHLGIDRAFT_129772 [Phlebiopsis gigantea 11061_1 CR5-6]